MLKIVLISLCIFSMSVTATTSSSLSSQNSDDETDSIQTNKKNETLSQSEIETDQQISTTIAPTESSVTESLKEDDENATTDEDMLEKPKETRLESNLSELISKKTPNEARIILQDLADQGDDESKLQLAIAYFYGNFGFKWEISFQYFNELAAKGKSLAHLVILLSNVSSKLIQMIFYDKVFRFYVRYRIGSSKSKSRQSITSLHLCCSIE